MSVSCYLGIGPQDHETMGNPSTTFFKRQYKRHTPFQQEPRMIQVSGNIDYGRKVNVILTRQADLLAKLYCVIDLGSLDTGDYQLWKDPTKDENDPKRYGAGSDVWCLDEGKEWYLDGAVMYNEAGENDPDIVEGGENAYRFDEGSGNGYHDRRFKMEFIRRLNYTIEDWLKQGHSLNHAQAHAAPPDGENESKESLFARLNNLRDSMGEEGWHNWVKVDPHFVNDVGRAILQNVTFEAGAVKYDELTPEFMHIWELLSIPGERHIPALTGRHDHDPIKRVKWSQRDQRLYIPLEFWFQRDYTMALPVIALHLTDLKITMTLKQKESILNKEWVSRAPSSVVQNVAKLEDMQIMAEYVYLDDNERHLMAAVPHQYLINQMQQTIETIPRNSSNHTVKLSFNHPIKQLVFVFRTASSKSNNELFDFGGCEKGKYDSHGFASLSLTLNNNDRVQEKDPLYYRYVQPSEHHTRVPGDENGKHIYVYSFALAPESSQPSGSLNFSRIEHVHLKVKFGSPTTDEMEMLIFARNINSVNVESGVSNVKWCS